MECFYCKKPPAGGIALELIVDAPGDGPTKRRVCFPCLSEVAEKIMVEVQKKKSDEEKK